jgi:hypothetical protein
MIDTMVRESSKLPIITTKASSRKDFLMGTAFSVRRSTNILGIS